jgi:N utilization substance protein A
MTRRRQNDFLGPNSAGQSGDIQQLPNREDVDNESVEELAEEGNAFEAEAVAGVDNAKDPDVSEVTTREVPEDDVPPEYLNDINKDVA